MGKYAQLANAADCKSVTLAVNIAGSIPALPTNMVACCNDGTRPVIFKIERIDVPETDEEKEWLSKQDFSNSADDAYTG